MTTTGRATESTECPPLPPLVGGAVWLGIAILFTLSFDADYAVSGQLAFVVLE